MRIDRLFNGQYSHFTCCSFFRRAERSFFAQGDVKMISFLFVVRDIPLRFISSNLNFSASYDRISPISVKLLRRVHYLSYSNFSVAVFRQVIGEKTYFRIFLRARGIFLSPVLTGSLEMLLFLLLID